MDAKHTTKSKSSTLPGRFQQRPVSAAYNGGFLGKLKRRFKLKSKNYDFETDTNTNVQCIYFKRGNEELTDCNNDTAANSKHDKWSFELFRSVSARSPSKPSDAKNKYEKETTNKKHSSAVKNNVNPIQNAPTEQNRYNLNDSCVNNDFIISSDSGIIDLDHEAHGALGHNDVIDDLDLDPGYETLDEIRRKLKIKVPPKIVTSSEPKESESEPANYRPTQHRRCQSSGTSEKFFTCLTDLDPRRDSGLGSPIVSDGPGSHRTSSCLTRSSATSDTDILGCHGNSRLGYRNQNELPVSTNLVLLKMNSCPLRQDFKDNSAVLESDNYQIDNQIACNSDTCLVQSPSKFHDPISELYANPKILLQKKSQKAEKAGQVKNRLGSSSSGCVGADVGIGQDHDTFRSQYDQGNFTESGLNNEMEAEPPPIPERKYSLDNILDSGICEPNLYESEIHYIKSDIISDEADRMENGSTEGHEDNLGIQPDHVKKTVSENSQSLCSGIMNVCDNDVSKSYHIDSVFNEMGIVQTSYEFDSEGKVQSITCVKKASTGVTSVTKGYSCQNVLSCSADSEKMDRSGVTESETFKTRNIAQNRLSSDSVQDRLSSEITPNRLSSEIIQNRLSSEMGQNKVNSESVLNRLSSELVQNNPSSELVRNRLSSDSVQNKLSSELLQNRLSSDSLQNTLSSAIIQNNQSSDSEQNSLSSEIVQNNQSSELVQNKVRSESVQNSLSAPKVCNPGYYGGLRFGWEVENINPESQETETTALSASKKFESESLNDIQLLDKLYEGAMMDSQISYEDDADAVLENLNTDLFIDESALNNDTDSSVVTHLNQKVFSDTNTKKSKVCNTRSKSEHHARSKDSGNDRCSEPFARLPDFYYHDNEPIHMSLSELGVSPPRINSHDCQPTCNDINLEELRRIRPKVNNKSKSSKNSSHSSHPNQNRDSGHLDDENCFDESKSELDERPPAIIPREKLIKDSKCHQDFMESMRQLKDCGWYWGPLSWDEAEIKLTNKPDGSFLVRDSSDDRYILSLSFNMQGRVHHTRIEHHKGKFSFWSQPDSHGKATIKDFIEQCVKNSKNGQFLYFIRPSGPGSPPMPVHLLHPISRFKQMRSLQHMCRFKILQIVRRDHIDQLPIPTRMKNYLNEAQYYVECLGDD